MLNTGKYKLLAALIGTAGGAYGSYKLYDCFGKAAVASVGSGESKGTPVQEAEVIIQPMSEVKTEPVVQVQEEKVEEIKEQVVENNEKPESNDESSQVDSKPPAGEKPSIEEPIVKQPEAEEPAAPVVVVSEPEVAEEEDIDEFDEDDEEPFEEPEVSQMQASPSKVQGNGAGQSSSAGTGSGTLNTSFYGGDGFIRIKPNTQGSKFQRNVILSTKDTEVWNKKVEDWNKDLDRYSSLSWQDKRGIDVMSKHFEIDRTKEMYKNQLAKALQHRCYTAYVKTGWQLKGIRDSREVKQYWKTVWKYCGQPTQQMPYEWRKQVQVTSK